MMNSETNDITGALCVFYSGSPFSDFSPHSFTIEDTVYASVEHFFQIQMLRSFGLFKLASKLSTIFDANNFRRTLRQNLRSLIQQGLFDDRMFNAWRATNAMRLMKRANRAKFEQNFDLKKHLLETGDRILVFTSKHDRLLGIGMDELTFLDWVRQQHWTIDDLLDNFTRQDSWIDGILGRNLLGFCLMDIRAEISGQPSVLSVWKHRSPQSSEETAGGSVEEAAGPSECSAIVDSDAGATDGFPDTIDDSDNRLTDEHILANLSNAEASIDDEEDSGSCHQTTEATVYRVPNERRIIYRRADSGQRPGSDVSTEQPKQSTVSVLPSKDADSRPADVHKRKQVLERLKALRFEKPMINPFADFTASSSTQTSFICQIAPETSRNIASQPATTSRSRKIPRLCDIPPIQGPLYGRRCTIVYPQLEPGEVPTPDYGPTMVPVAYPSNFGTQRVGPTQGVSSSNACMHPSSNQQPLTPQFPSCSSASSIESSDDSGELWIPSSNPMKEVFESAKVGIKKLIENAKQSNASSDDISRLLLLRPPPIQSQPHARKRTCTQKKAAPSYSGVIFNSKDAQMRHMSNRWVKGGRLTTTGKFEECQSDEEQDDEDTSAEEVGRTLRQLEAVPATMDTENKGRPETPVQFHVVYEDTNEYADYVKWYADVHGCSPSDVVDDEYQRYLRQWYRWYRTAVKFVDVEPLSDNEECNEESAASNQDDAERLMQQWRWQQINEWELKTRKRSAAEVQQETYSDGVSVSGKPVAYNAVG